MTLKRLKNTGTQSTFTLKLKNKYQALADSEKHAPQSASSIDTMSEQIKVAYTQTSEACLGRRQKKRKECMDHSR